MTLSEHATRVQMQTTPTLRAELDRRAEAVPETNYAAMRPRGSFS